MSDRLTTGTARWLVLGLVVLLVGTLTAVYLVRAAAEQDRARTPTAATVRDRILDYQAVTRLPHIEFRSTAPGPTYGRVAAVPLSNAGGPRGVSDRNCDRISTNGSVLVCLTVKRGVLTSYRGTVTGGRPLSRLSVKVNGMPSRTRVSTAGNLAATTVFVTGHSYSTMDFSTETRIFRTGVRKDYGNLEKTFVIRVNGKRSRAADLNVWGVTFVPGAGSDRFYATVATGGRTYLAVGDLSARTLTTQRQGVECPSLSPDGRIIVYKHRAGSPITWRYHALELASGRDWALGETRSVDDQVEWLDNVTVLYGLQRPGTARSDVWRVGLQPQNRPTLFIPDAWSPGVVRVPGSAFGEA